MNSPDRNGFRPGDVSQAEETLRILAHLPPPEGLVSRVQARLESSPKPDRKSPGFRTWGTTGWTYANALRGAAAAAIVCVVAGGGWQIYTHVQPAASLRVIVAPGLVAPASGFSTAAGRATPNSPNGPVLTHSVAPAPEIPVVEKQNPAPKTRGKAVRPRKPAVRLTLPQ